MEKCPEKARANDPNPPRVTSPEAVSDEAGDAARPDELSPPKKLLRDDDHAPWPLPDHELREEQGALGWASDAIPGCGAQVSRGISA
jgi:hypothetical protein